MKIGQYYVDAIPDNGIEREDEHGMSGGDTRVNKTAEKEEKRRGGARVARRENL